MSRNHCWQTLFLYIRVYMPSLDCTLLRSRGGGGGAIFLKVHLPEFMRTKRSVRLSFSRVDAVLNRCEENRIFEDEKFSQAVL